MASRRGVLLLVVFLLLLGAVTLAVAQRLRHPSSLRIERQMLVYDVPTDIDEGPPTSEGFSLAAFRPDRANLLDVTFAIRRAADDAQVRALVLHVDEVQWGWARVEELRSAIAEFHSAGKKVYVSLEGGSDQAYLLAAAADVVSMPPTARLQLDGLTASAMFLRGTYDKLGISPNFAHVGQFKSAVEQYTNTQLSPSGRVALEALLDDQYRMLVDSLASARGVTPDSMRSVIDEGPYTASAANRAGLVDTLMDTADLDSLAAGSGSRRLGNSLLTDYADEIGQERPAGESVALVLASGTIMPGRSREGGWQGSELGSETVVRALRQAREKRSIKAVVLRIDSPGGSGQASDDIWQEVRRLRRVKPVVVSMSNLAASGGYYIACGADAIIAEPGTITGSIGVFGGKLNIMGLYRKLGLNIETVSRGRNAEMMSPFRDFSPDEAARYQAQMDDFYQTFLARVSAGRGMSIAAADSLAQGRVWSGVAAEQAGLVDSLGGLQMALDQARRLGKIGEDGDLRIELLPRPHRSYFGRWVADWFEEDGTSDAQAQMVLPPIVAAWLSAARFPAGTALAMLPFAIDIR